MATARKAAARQLAEDYAGLVSIAQAKQMLAILDDNAKHARWCCETIKQATARDLFPDKLDPVLLARSIAKRKGWEPALKKDRGQAASILATVAGLLRNT